VQLGRDPAAVRPLPGSVHAIERSNRVEPVDCGPREYYVLNSHVFSLLMVSDRAIVRVHSSLARLAGFLDVDDLVTMGVARSPNMDLVVL
jgi:hypothetical protein